MLFAIAVSALLQAAAPEGAPEPELGKIEFIRENTRQSFDAIQIYIVEDDKQMRYLADIGSGGSRTLSLEAPEGTHKFIVIVQTSATGVSSGGDSDIQRRRRPNVTLDVKPGHVTEVKIGGFMQAGANRSVGDPSQSVFSTASGDPGGSQFQTRINVGKPKKIKEKD